MKALIWVLTFFIGTIINTFLGAVAGFRAGAFLLYIVEAYIASKLCKKWDEKQQKKKAEKAKAKEKEKQSQESVVPFGSRGKAFYDAEEIKKDTNENAIVPSEENEKQ